MKRGAFILILILFFLLITYAPQLPAQDNSVCSGKKPPCPEGCGVETRQENVKNMFGCETRKDTAYCIPLPENTECFSTDTRNFISKDQSVKNVPINFKYEGKETTGWEINARRDTAQIIMPALKGKPKNMVISPTAIASPISTSNCKYYTFGYQRKENKLSYIFDREQAEPVILSGETKESCLYNSDQLKDDLNIIPGRPLTITSEQAFQKDYYYLDDVCIGYQDEPTEDGSCSPTAQCEINVKKGPQSFYGFVFKKDSCGNRVVKMANNGEPITDSRQAAQQVIAECQNELGNMQIPEEIKCGDNIDNDKDGFTDCADEDCLNTPDCKKFKECNDFYNELLQTQGKNIDFTQTISVDFDIAKGNGFDDSRLFPEKDDSKLTVTMKAKHFNIFTHVPKSINLKIEVYGKKLDNPPEGNYIIAKSPGDKDLFSDIRAAVIKKVDKIAPDYDKIDDIFIEDIIMRYITYSKTQLQEWVKNADVPGTTADDVKVKDTIEFTFMLLDELPEGGEKETLKQNYNDWSWLYSLKGYDISNPAIIRVKEQFEITDYNGNLLSPFPASPRIRGDLYIPTLSRSRKQIPLPWTLVNEKNTDEFVLKLNSDPLLTNDIIEGEYTIVPYKTSDISLLEKLKECKKYAEIFEKEQ